jgi:hypothetical protein
MAGQVSRRAEGGGGLAYAWEREKGGGQRASSAVFSFFLSPSAPPGANSAACRHRIWVNLLLFLA